MSQHIIQIPEGLQRLKPSSDLESVSVSRLARKGTEVLSQITESAQAVTVQVQGLGSMVTVSRRQYDEMVELIHSLSLQQADDGFSRALSERFDTLVASMNEPGASKAIDEALFAEPAKLNANYQPGATESGTGKQD